MRPLPGSPLNHILLLSYAHLLNRGNLALIHNLVEAVATEMKIDDIAIVDAAITDVSMYCEVLLGIPEIKLPAASVTYLAILQVTHLLPKIKSWFYMCSGLGFALPSIGILATAITRVRGRAAALIRILGVGGNIGVWLHRLGWMGFDISADLEESLQLVQALVADFLLPEEVVLLRVVPTVGNLTALVAHCA